MATFACAGCAGFSADVRIIPHSSTLVKGESYARVCWPRARGGTEIADAASAVHTYANSNTGEIMPHRSYMSPLALVVLAVAVLAVR
jgi:hypothetical protein